MAGTIEVYFPSYPMVPALNLGHQLCSLMPSYQTEYGPIPRIALHYTILFKSLQYLPA
jgi:hypothetical protein